MGKTEQDGITDRDGRARWLPRASRDAETISVFGQRTTVERLRVTPHTGCTGPGLSLSTALSTAPCACCPPRATRRAGPGLPGPQPRQGPRPFPAAPRSWTTLATARQDIATWPSACLCFLCATPSPPPRGPKPRPRAAPGRGRHSTPHRRGPQQASAEVTDPITNF